MNAMIRGFFVVACCISLLVARSSRTMLPKKLPPQYTHKEVFEILLNKPLPPSCRYTRYSLNIAPPFCWFTADLWLNIMDHMTGMTLWDFGLTCKCFGALVRDNELNYRQGWNSIIAIQEIMTHSQLKIDDGMWEIIEPEVDNFLALDVGESTVQLKACFVESFINRKCSPFILQLIVQKYGRIQTEKYLSLIPSEHLFVLPGTEQPRYHYLPPAGTKIFDLIPTSVLGLLMSSGSKPQNQMFSITILAEYLLPAFNGRIVLKEHELQAISDLYPSLRFCFDDCINLILWAIYLGFGVINKGKSPKLRSIIGFFKDISMTWSEMRAKLPGKIRLDKLMRLKSYPDMNAVLMIAKYWKLDFENIAQNTRKWSHLSMQIDDGDIPLRFLSDRLPSSLELFQLIYGTEPQTFVDSAFTHVPKVDDVNEARGVKRPRKRQNTNVTKKEKGPVRQVKKQKISKNDVTTSTNGTTQKIQQPETSVTIFSRSLSEAFGIYSLPPTPTFRFDYFHPPVQPSIYHYNPPNLLEEQQSQVLPLAPAGTEPIETEEIDWESYLEPEYRDFVI